MKGDPVITVVCDDCGAELDVSMTPLAGRAWDDRDVDRRLRRADWCPQGDMDFCPDCREG
jgi:hypothetical protein